jgi:6-phosphogluconolactonase
MKVAAILDKDALVAEAARRLATALREAVEARGSASFATSGGSTPGPIHRALVALGHDHVPWKRVSVYFVDERCVPPSSQDSNYRLARETLLDPLGILSARVHRMEGERPDREQAAKDYAARLPEALDVVLLGMGEDGHTASLFPGPDLQSALDAPKARRAVGLLPDPLPQDSTMPRVTLTRAAILSARTVIIALSGQKKRELLEQAIADGQSSKLPIGRVLAEAEQPIDIHWCP